MFENSENFNDEKKLQANLRCILIYKKYFLKKNSVIPIYHFLVSYCFLNLFSSAESPDIQFTFYLFFC